MYFIQEMTQADQQEIIKWRYAAPYERYNLTAEEFEQEDHFYSVFSKSELIGMLKLHYNEGTCFLGLGMRPDLTNQGHGQKFVQTAIDFIKKQGFQHIRLVVATYNERAIKVYERCGLEETDYELMLAGDVLEEFVIMEYGVENR